MIIDIANPGQQTSARAINGAPRLTRDKSDTIVEQRGGEAAVVDHRHRAALGDPEPAITVRSASEVLASALKGMTFDLSPHQPAAPPLPVDAAHAEVFDLEELLDALFRAPVNFRMGPMPLSFMPPKGAILPRISAR